MIQLYMCVLIYINNALIIYIYFRLFSIIGYYKILNTVPCTVCFGEGNGNPLQHSCLENSMDRGDWQAIYSPWGHKESDMTEHATCHMTEHASTHYTLGPCCLSSLYVNQICALSTTKHSNRSLYPLRF